MDLDVLFPGAPAVDIAGLAYDNRAVGPRDLFFCVRGFTRDGHDFAADAVQRGAAALVVDHLLDMDIPQVVVADVRRAMPPAAASFYGKPTESLDLVGITGYERQDDNRIPGARGARGRWPPDRPAGNRQERDRRRRSLMCSAQHRGDRPSAVIPRDARWRRRRLRDGGLVARARTRARRRFAFRRRCLHEPDAGPPRLPSDDGGLLPGQTQVVHRRRSTPTAVINLDDAYGRRLATDPEIPTPITFALDHPGATYRADDLRTDLDGSHFTLHSPDGVAELSSPLRGRFNVSNVLAAFATARAPRSAVRHGRGRDRARRPGARAIRDGRRGAELRGARRLCPHPGFAREVLISARNLTEGKPARRLRLWR